MSALQRWPRLLAEPDAAAYLSIGKTMLRDRGPVPRKVGRRVLYDIKDLDRWADRLAAKLLDEAPEPTESDDATEAAEVERRIMERLGNGHG